MPSVQKIVCYASDSERVGAPFAVREQADQHERDADHRNQGDRRNRLATIPRCSHFPFWIFILVNMAGVQFGRCIAIFVSCDSRAMLRRSISV